MKNEKKMTPQRNISKRNINIIQRLEQTKAFNCFVICIVLYFWKSSTHKRTPTHPHKLIQKRKFNKKKTEEGIFHSNNLI